MSDNEARNSLIDKLEEYTRMRDRVQADMDVIMQPVLALDAMIIAIRKALEVMNDEIIRQALAELESDIKTHTTAWRTTVNTEQLKIIINALESLMFGKEARHDND